jgi:hypothetical protein
MAQVESYPQSFEVPQESDGHDYSEIHAWLPYLQFNVHQTKKDEAPTELTLLL